jgi:uncharacterized protein (TIGR02186 family)
MRRPLLLALLAIVVLGRQASAEQLTIALSTSGIKIDSNFTGASVTVFGVIERDAATVARTAGYQIAVVLKGPGENVVARRKDRILGIWANSESATIVAAPSFYALSTSTGLDALAEPDELRRLQLGPENVNFTYLGSPGPTGQPAVAFREAFLRLKEQSGLYSAETGVDFIGDTIFRTSIWIPANVPVGRYTAVAMLFADRTALARAEETIDVSKTGFEEYLFSLSRRQSLAYGLAIVSLALFVGWLGGVIFRRD